MIVATWKHRGGSEVTLEAFSSGGYGYSAPGMGGAISAESDADAIAELQTRIDAGWLSRDAWTTNYERVSHA